MGLFSGITDFLFGGGPKTYDATDPNGLIKHSAYSKINAANWERERQNALKAAKDALNAQRRDTGALDLLRDQATGRAQSVAIAQAEKQRALMQAQAASQAASGRGAYDPTRQRAAMFALQQGLGNLGGAAAAAQAQERIAAQNAYAQAAARRYQQELAAEQARRAQSMGLLGMKAQELAGNRAVQIQEGKDRANLATGQQQIQSQTRAQNIGLAGSLVGAVGAGLAGGK